MTKIDRFRAGTQLMSAPERKAMYKALEAAIDLQDAHERDELFNAIVQIGEAANRAARKRESDSRTDVLRRRLVGARLPLEQVQRCKICAKLLGISTYRFVADALEEACQRVENGRPKPGGRNQPQAVPDWPGAGSQEVAEEP